MRSTSNFAMLWKEVPRMSQASRTHERRLEPHFHETEPHGAKESWISQKNENDVLRPSCTNRIPRPACHTSAQDPSCSSERPLDPPIVEKSDHRLNRTAEAKEPEQNKQTERQENLRDKLSEPATRDQSRHHHDASGTPRDLGDVNEMLCSFT